MPGLHHVDIWVPDFDAVRPQWQWLFERLGSELLSEWTGGAMWSFADSYVSVSATPAVKHEPHDRHRPGVNHIAFRAGPASAVDSLMSDAAAHGWSPLYHDRYPFAGGEQHYAGWLENSAGFKVEVVADEWSAQ